LHDVTVNAATGGIVDDDVAFRANEIVYPPVNGGIARGLIVGTARMDGNDTRTRVVTTVDVVRDFLGLRRQIGFIVLFAIPPVGAIVTITFRSAISFSLGARRC